MSNTTVPITKVVLPNLALLLEHKILEVSFAELTELDIPVGIDQVILRWVTGLTSVVVPPSVKKLLIERCPNLRTVIVDGAKDVEISDCPEFVSYKGSPGVRTLKLLRNPKLVKLELQNAIDVVDLTGSTGLQAVDIGPGTIRAILDDCTGLTSAVLSRDVMEASLRGCTNLVDLLLFPGIRSVDVSGCTSISEIDLPLGAKLIMERCRIKTIYSSWSMRLDRDT